MWSIVIFIESNTVAAVPTQWYSNGMCAWPKSHVRNKNKMVELRTPSNSFDFDFFKARRLAADKSIGMYNFNFFFFNWLDIVKIKMMIN